MSDRAATVPNMGLALIIDAPAPGEENMARDLALLDACARNEIPGAVRLYGFAPACLSLGRMQSLDDVDLEACASDGVDVVRRPSGGRAVLHDQEVTYAVVCRSTDPIFGGRVLESCSRIHEAVAAGLVTSRRVDDTTRDACQRQTRRPRRRSGRGLLCPTRSPRTARRSWTETCRQRAGETRRRAPSARIGAARAPRAARYLRGGAVPSQGGVGIRDLLGRRVSRDELVDALAAGFSRALEETA